jgi:xanthine dehydrogenase accessory factor
MNQAEFAKMVDTLVGKGEAFAVATVTRTEGSTLGKPGFKVMISAAGEVLSGSLGGACPESAIVPSVKKTIMTRTPKTVKVYLESTEDAVGAVVTSRNEDEIHVETNCGGMMEIYIEPYMPARRLVIIGQGGKDDVEDALVSLGKSLDFDVVVIDHSPMLREKPDRLIRDIDFDLTKFEFADSDSVVVLTKGERDLEVLQVLSKLRLKYVGLLASSQRARDDMARLREAGADEEFVASLRAPVGADIGALTPAEIALSILAEVVAVKYGKSLPRKGAPADFGPRQTKQ